MEGILQLHLSLLSRLLLGVACHTVSLLMHCGAMFAFTNGITNELWDCCFSIPWSQDKRWHEKPINRRLLDNPAEQEISKICFGFDDLSQFSSVLSFLINTILTRICLTTPIITLLCYTCLIYLCFFFFSLFGIWGWNCVAFNWHVSLATLFLHLSSPLFFWLSLD